MKSQNQTAVLLLSCPDQKGIVAEISHFIFINGGNIIDFDQHTDSESDTYFMRMEWEIHTFSIPQNKIGDAFSYIADKFHMKWQLSFSEYIPRMAIFVSQFDHCLYDLLLRRQAGEIRVDIPLIISNHDSLRKVADYFEVPFHYIPINKENHSEQEKKQLKLLEANQIDLIVLARYMQIVGDEFTTRYENRIINIHHSFLPAFVGAKPYHQAHSRGVKIIGATSHYATPDLDQGPIIEQDVVRVSHRDSIPDLVEKGKNLEKLVLSRAVRLHLENKILVYRNKTVIFD